MGMGVLLVYTLAILIVLIYFVFGLLVRTWFTAVMRKRRCAEFPCSTEDKLLQNAACFGWPGVFIAGIYGIVLAIQGKEIPSNPFDDNNEGGHV